MRVFLRLGHVAAGVHLARLKVWYELSECSVLCGAKELELLSRKFVTSAKVCCRAAAGDCLKLELVASG